ncbi:hypothetical protein KM043_008546 [Ampulex compressa]|nr:hypothetical protein KM043_008546 [Ampulex compressa]
MTRGRRLTLASGACMGMFLLLFGHVAGDATTILSKARPEEGRSFQGNTTLLSKVSPADNGAFSPSRAERESQGLRGGKEERGAAAAGLEANSSVETGSQEVGATVSGDEVERSSTPDPGRSRPEEGHYETSGKSSSTKTTSEDPFRLSRTNGLTTVTAKLEEVVFKHEQERRERTGKVQEDPRKEEPSSTAMPVKQRAGVVSAMERSLERERAIQEGDPRKDDVASSAMPRPQKSRTASEKERSLEKERSVDGDSTASGNPGLTEEKRARGQDAGSRNSEARDLVKVERKEDGEVISLINDTNVNYSHYYRTLAEAGNQSSSSGSQGNLISEDADVSHRTENPKEEVEVVENVTRAPLERIQQEENPLAKKEPSGKDERSARGNETSADNQESGSKDDGLGIGKDENDTRVTLTPKSSSEKPSSEVRTSTLDGNASLVPRGRTISFSGANDFPTLEAKTTAASKQLSIGHEKDPNLAKKNTSVERTIDQKPYPYLRSTKETSSESSSKAIRDHRAETTEETSAFENTIGREQSDRKFVVTEPSVVIENSIQQFRTTFDEKSGNDSTSNSTTESHSTAAVTTIALALSRDVRPTNESLMERPRATEAVTLEANVESTSKESEKTSEGGGRVETITEKDESFDVTGNGITEISLRPEIPVSKEPPRDTSTRSPSNHTLGTTASNDALGNKTESKAAPNLDVQTDAEESLLIRSTLNATELSTEYPLTKENFTESVKQTVTPGTTLNSTMESSSIVPSTNPVNSTEGTSTPKTTTSPSTALANSTEENSTINVTLGSLGTQGYNGTNEIPGGESTLNPDEVSPPTTTNVEYVFVGLTETTQPSNRTSTERATEESTLQDTTEVASITTTLVSTASESTTRQYSTEDYPGTSTMNPEGITEVPSTSIEADTTEPEASMSTTLEGEEVGSTSGPTIKEDVTSRSTIANDPEAGSTDGISRITIDTSTPREEVSTKVESTTRRANFAGNATEVSTRATVDHSTSTSKESFTQQTENFVGSNTPKPRIIESSTWSSQGTPSTERTSDVTQTLSPDEITSLVRIVLKGSLQEVCPHQQALRQALADMLRDGVNKPVSANQIRFHQNPCLEPSSPAPTPTDTSLTSILVYVVDEEGKFDGAMTNILPNLYNASPINFPVTIHSFLLVQETDSGNAIAVVVVSSVAFICLVLLAGLLFIMRKRQTRFNYGERCRPVSLDAYSLDSVSAYNSVRRKGAARSSKRSYGNPTFEDSSAIPSHPLNFAGLSSFCNDVNAINEEFSGIPQVSAKIDELPAGAEVRNRYANVIPLPETRVPLQKTNNDPLTEYINASYVRGPKNAMKYYIACQAPLESTVTDFWRMIWEQQSKVIIMLTDLVENGVEKCTEYIPPSEVTDCHRLYGDYQVTLKKRETKEKYAISTLHLKNLENNTFREVFHIWYLWPVSGVQSDGAGLIAVLLEARALQRGGPGPIVVHCSPGTGRTGTLIALDLGIRQYEITRTVDVPRVVYTIRRDRAGAVQTKEQYAFIYKALNLYATKLAGGVLDST